MSAEGIPAEPETSLLPERGSERGRKSDGVAHRKNGLLVEVPDRFRSGGGGAAILHFFYYEHLVLIPGYESITIASGGAISAAASRGHGLTLIKL